MLRAVLLCPYGNGLPAVQAHRSSNNLMPLCTAFLNYRKVLIHIKITRWSQGFQLSGRPVGQLKSKLLLNQKHHFFLVYNNCYGGQIFFLKWKLPILPTLPADFFSPTCCELSRTVTFGSWLLLDMAVFLEIRRGKSGSEKVHFGWVSRMMRGFGAIWRRTGFGGFNAL